MGYLGTLEKLMHESRKSRVRLPLNKKMRFRRKYLCEYLPSKWKRTGLKLSISSYFNCLNAVKKRRGRWHEGPRVKKIKLLYMQCTVYLGSEEDDLYLSLHTYIPPPSPEKIDTAKQNYYRIFTKTLFLIYFFYSNIITKADIFCLWFLAFIIKY